MQPHFDLERERSNTLIYKEFKNDTGPFHFHSQPEFYFIDEGKMEVFINNQHRVLKKGEMSVALSFDAHCYLSLGETKSSVLVIPPHMCEGFMQSISRKKIINPFICNADAVKEIKSCIEKIKSNDINEFRLCGYIYVILGIVMENIYFEDYTSSVDLKLSNKILLYINENIKNDISLSSLSAAFGYSKNYLSQYFISNFGISFTKYVNLLRLRNALKLMQNKEHTVTYCALESGFNSVRTFYRVYKELKSQLQETTINR